jgi:CubicO group peptidase (beta-lactamase class C family)
MQGVVMLHRCFVSSLVLFAAAVAPLGGQAVAGAMGPDTVVRHGQVRIEFAGKYQTKYAQDDRIVERWMNTYGIPAAQLAFRKSGTLLFSHAYTRGSGGIVTTANVMRLASVSKMTPTAAVTQLYASGKLTPGLLVFPYLGITKPLLKSQTPDPNINKVTVQELVDHTGGFHGEGSGDPLFMMRDIEVLIKHEPLTKMQFARYVYGLPLQFVPGTQTLYSNVGYQLLGMVVERATGHRFVDYVNQSVMAPLGITNVSLGSTVFANRNPAEVIPSDPYTGPSVLDLSQSAPMRPLDYEGGDIIWENADSAADFETNAESISLFIHTYNVYGLGGRQADYARSGCVPGVATWAESLANNVDAALFFNSQPCLSFGSMVIANLRNALMTL